MLNCEEPSPVSFRAWAWEERPRLCEREPFVFVGVGRSEKEELEGDEEVEARG